MAGLVTSALGDEVSREGEISHQPNNCFKLSESELLRLGPGEEAAKYAHLSIAGPRSPRRATILPAHNCKPAVLSLSLSFAPGVAMSPLSRVLDRFRLEVPSERQRANYVERLVKTFHIAGPFHRYASEVCRWEHKARASQAHMANGGPDTILSARC